MTEHAWLLFAVGLLALALVLVAERYWRRRKAARAYLDGVRYVLSDDTDAAAAVLSDAARLGSRESADTYLALGALFRRTGDLARAIRLHRNMLLQPGLDPAQRPEVERELAHDYRLVGMLDEALAAYRALADGGDRAAREGQRDVLVDLGRLAEAAEVQRQLTTSREDPLLAHLLAALAREELARDRERGYAAALQAVAANPRSADGLLALAEAHGALGRPEEAREAIGAALAEDASAALLAWPALAGSGDPAAALPWIEERLARSQDDAALQYLRGRLLRAAGRPHEAMAALRAALERDATGEVTLAMRDLLGEAEAPAPAELAERHALMVAALLRKARPMRCKRCGAEAPTRPWRCKRCGAFESFVPPAAV